METLVRLAGLAHLGILAVALLVPRVLDWRARLAVLDPFLRRMFWVYGAHIALVIAGLGILTVVHAGALVAGDPLGRGIAALAAAFWGLRLVVQVGVFGLRPPVPGLLAGIGYHALTVAFVALTATYGTVALS